MIKIITGGTIIAGVVMMMTSCKKEKGKEVATEDFSYANKSVIQVFNASIPSAATDPRRNYVYADAKPLTGASLTYGSLFPAAGSGSAVTAGFREFLIRDTLVTTTQPPISFAETFQAGKSYTIFMYDTFNVVKQKTVESNIVIPDDTTARLRFANFAYFPTITAGIDIFSVNRNAFVVTNLLPTQVTDYIPYASGANDTYYVTESGNPSNKLDTLANFNPTRKRSYTLIFRGRWRTNEGGGAANPRVLSAFANN